MLIELPPPRVPFPWADHLPGDAVYIQGISDQSSLFAGTTGVADARYSAEQSVIKGTETTFQEARSALGLETTRGRCRSTVLRAAPCLFGLYTVVAVLFQALPESKRAGAVVWPGKATVTFSDALCAVRRWLWAEAVLPQAGDNAALEKLPPPVRELLLTTLVPAT